jgi:pimeloyl-ACP methyl ester carboxylesterase
MPDAGFPILTLQTPRLTLAYEAHGPAQGEPIVLLHGFPYDPRCYDQVAPVLAGKGYRVIVPYLRGYGPTRFRSEATMRSGQQAALAQDLLDLLDGLSISQAAVAGYDWGGRAACIVAALWPERVRCLVSGDGYNIQDIAGFSIPLDPATEYRYWYQYYFHSPRGRDGLAAHRYELCKLLWRLWSPSWKFDEATYARSAASFDNLDFVDVVVHSYRHRFGYAIGDLGLESIESRLAQQPAIAVPAISLCGLDDGVGPPAEADEDRPHFAGPYERRLLPGVGHNIPQEAPEATVTALLDLLHRQ